MTDADGTGTDHDALMAAFAREERVDVERFGHDEAWWLGVWLRDRLVERGVVGAVAVYLGDQRAFVGSTGGSSADLDGWLDRKARTVRNWGCSSFALKHRFLPHDPGFPARLLLDPRGLAAAGGGFPIRIRGAIVGVACCSGWTEEGEHALAVEGVHALAEQQRTEPAG